MTQAPRLLIVCQDLPFPTIHGGRLEMWSRLLAWRDLGARMHVIFWSLDDTTSRVAVEALTSLGIGVSPIVRRRTILSLVQSKLPPLAYSMRPSSTRYPALREAARVFAPESIVLENWPGALTAFALAADLKLPLLYRAQNVETSYWREIHGSARGLERLRFGLTARRVERLERAIRQSASLVLEISEDDARESSAMGMGGRGVVLPPVWRTQWSLRPEELRPRAEVDVLFGGSLWPPHHVEGIQWLLTVVMPEIHRKVGREVSVRIVGSQPTPQVMQLAAASGVQVKADVADFPGELLRARVLVNPVRRSSGINMKMLELLTSGLPVVSTRAGLRGLSEPVKRLAIVADSALEFADSIVRLLASDPVSSATESTGVVSADYGVSAQQRLFEYLRTNELPAAQPFLL